jgi:uncharacterized protein YegJ (DUF2314 family)
MAAAISQARVTTAEFIQAWNDQLTTRSGFSVQTPVSDGDRTEHVWVSLSGYDAGNFHGTVNNQPDRITMVQKGDEVTIPREQISDWMYVEDGVLVGGYTLRALRDRMSDSERNAFDGSLSFRIE